MNKVDTERLGAAATNRAIGSMHKLAAERKGRATAFKDIELKGFSYAYRETQAVDWMETSMLTYENKGVVKAFEHAYKQAVLGFWMAME